MDNNYDLTEYVDKLYSVAVSKAQDSFVAEDITQEALLAALIGLSRGQKPDNLWAWLVRILSNKYCDYLRDKYNKPQISFDDYQFDIADDNDFYANDEYTGQLEAVRRELGFLAKTHREVMVRFYMHGHSIEKIAKDLSIPLGTVKSRLNTGRKHIRERVNEMENYTKQSYEPDILRMSCSGGVGLNDEPFSLVDEKDKLTQNVLILAYEKPVTETELAKSLGVPVVFIEPIVEKMIDGELMKRTESGKIYTDFIIYTEKDRKTTFSKQLETVDKNFDLFWVEIEKALSELREKEYYKRQTEHAKSKLELHFCIDLLMGGCIDVRNEVTGIMPYSDYPYRKNGGRWFAMGQQYPPDYDYKNDKDFWKYSISGEAGTEIRNFRDAKYLELRKYDTELGSYPNCYFRADYIKWFYELLTNVAHEDSAVGDNVLEAAEDFITSGILKKDDAVTLNIPILSHEEYHDEKRLSATHHEKLSKDIHDIMIKLFDNGYVRLQSHLKSVPKWQQYMYCGDSVPMAVIHKAIEKGMFLKDFDYPIPASILVIDK
ncbi:MAG: hypothetical protein A2Y17_01630 [Clostridiales bacterium GWF2_38_85]|nr:MAG: hypothetical protein A2Y17_01630 [Clostridiales bacterium GWF2_38_85]